MRGDEQEPEVVTGSREQLFHLLAEAAEIEHTLMCCYLYAAFSLKRGEAEGLSPTAAGVVERWRAAIMEVAIQEMGHLLIVANLTVSVGGRPHFGRPNLPVSSGYFPSGVVVRLTGFSRDTLEHFIFLERPQGTPGADSQAFDQELHPREQAHRGLMPSAQDYATVGHLYEAIRVNLTTLSRELGEERVFIGGVDLQVGPDIVNFEGVMPIDGLGAAHRALDVIVEQGEGSLADHETSHYRRFIAVRDEFDALSEEDPGFEPAWKVAESPVLRRPADPEGNVFIDDPQAATLLDFACASYGLLLRLLVQSFCRGSVDAARQQKTLVTAAVDLMHVLADAASGLARLPASPSEPAVNAGMSFTMLRGIEPLIQGGVEEQLLREQLGTLAGGAKAVGLERATMETLERLSARFAL